MSGDLTDLSKEIPLSLVKARAQPKMAKPATSKGQTKTVVDKKKKKTKRPVASRRRIDSSEPDDPDRQEEDPEPGPILYEGDPGFEEAFERSRRERAARSGIGNPSGRSTPRRTPEADTSAPPAPARRQRTSAITGLPYVGPDRRPEALHTYGDGQRSRRYSPVGVRNTRVAPPPPSARVTQANPRRPAATRPSSTNLPTAPADRPHRDVYVRMPDGSHHHYTDNSGIPAYIVRPEPPEPGADFGPRIGFTPNQRREGQLLQAQINAQINTQSPYQMGSAQPVGLCFSNYRYGIRH